MLLKQKQTLTNYNTPFSYSRTGKSLYLKLIRGVLSNANDINLFLMIFPRMSHHCNLIAAPYPKNENGKLTFCIVCIDVLYNLNKKHWLLKESWPNVELNHQLIQFNIRLKVFQIHESVSQWHKLQKEINRHRRKKRIKTDKWHLHNILIKCRNIKKESNLLKKPEKKKINATSSKKVLNLQGY